MINASPKTGRIYQHIGNFSGETGLNVDFTAIKLTGRAFADITVELWYGGTVGNAADGATLDTTIGASLGDSFTVTGVTLVQSVSDSLSFTGATSGDALWLSFGKLTAGDSVGVFDDVSISVIPEPSSLLLLGIAALGFLITRKRR